MRGRKCESAEEKRRLKDSGIKIPKKEKIQLIWHLPIWGVLLLKRNVGNRKFFIHQNFWSALMLT